MDMHISQRTQDSSYKSDEVLAKLRAAVQNINKTNPLPLYQQLLQELYKLLLSDELKPGSFFATESLLQEYTGMSRDTVRKTLEELVRRGMLVRITGKGTFVAIPDIPIVATRLRSLTQELREKGTEPGSTNLAVEWTTPSKEVAEHLKIQDKVLFVRRIRTGNGVPLIYSCVYLPPDIGITPDMEIGVSIYKLLSKHGRHPNSAIHNIKAVNIPKDIARLLGVNPLAAGLQLQRITYDGMDTPIMFEEGIGRGDHYGYTLKMQNYTEM